jgi:lysophospholipase L1-like esterase
VVEQAPAIPVPVGYAPATATGGVAPVSVTCTHPSGTSFNLGKTDVVCSAADSAPVTTRASCSFSVTVSQSFQVGATKFLAFGDSITKGEVEYNLAGRRILAVEPDKAYPTVLQRLLSQRYPQQQISVANEGVPGMPAACQPLSDFCGVDYLSEAIRETEPQVLLLLQGVIDISQKEEAGIGPMVDALRDMVREAKARGVSHVFLSTLLPLKPSAGPDRRDQALEFVVPANDEIRHLAATQDVYLVDAYSVFVGNEATYLGADGLHPTHAGYEALAGAFFSQIQARLETVVSTPTGVQRLLRVSASDRPHVEVGFQRPRPSIRFR